MKDCQLAAAVFQLQQAKGNGTERYRMKRKDGIKVLGMLSVHYGDSFKWVFNNFLQIYENKIALIKLIADVDWKLRVTQKPFAKSCWLLF